MNKESKPNEKSARPSARPGNYGTHSGGTRSASHKPASRAALARRKKQKRKAILLRIILLLAVIGMIIAAVVLVNRRRKADRPAETNMEQASAEAVQETSEGEITAEKEETAEASPEDTEETASEEASDRPADLPDINVEDWEFILANPWNSVEDYTPEVGTIEGIQLDTRIIPAMEQFVADCRAAGNTVFLSSGYRDYDTQTFLFNRKVEQYGDEDVAATIVARPGTSEHQTGLAADITDQYYETKNESLEYTAMYQWMFAHCQEYGFILRFPKGRDDVTGIIYEPWHFRYVGVEAATYIMEHELTLEEFLACYKDIAGPEKTE